MIRLAARQLPGGDGLLECNEVHRHLVGVRRTEGTHGLIEGRCGPEVGGDRDGIAGSSVRTTFAPSPSRAVKRLPSRGTPNIVRAAISTWALISTAVTRARGKRRWMNLASEPPPKPTIKMRLGCG